MGYNSWACCASSKLDEHRGGKLVTHFSDIITVTTTQPAKTTCEGWQELVFCEMNEPTALALAG